MHLDTWYIHRPTIRRETEVLAQWLNTDTGKFESQRCGSREDAEVLFDQLRDLGHHSDYTVFERTATVVITDWRPLDRAPNHGARGTAEHSR
ncbi:hypothetical protein [Bailinhaonella thermotolerans]|uniref:Uncharacterized protein n=1 Tax=Bailinhaonella thermotolerans TaxID=1070861 RepID=A0A3A4AGQ5_9ACTN|nr:hypothetical protein [Bailinhaonella thermotolerans]RJL19570.1 hypothetical protein D5H75_40235 [Bailinhaonella thermotolerans]